MRPILTATAATTTAVALALMTTCAALGDGYDTSAGPVTMTQVVGDLDQPWGFGFLPDGGLLITERDGAMLHIGADGQRSRVRGLPKVEAEGQGGLLDVLIPRDFAQTRQVYVTYAKPQGRGSGTALAVGTLSDNGSRLRDVRVVWEMARGTAGGRHFGSRVVEGRDGHLYITIGDRGDRNRAQDLSLENGTVVRIARDGSIPADNPFVGQAGAQPGIWSYGHRNPQGAALDSTGQLWVVEHGAKGGDEVNLVTPGTNYGWPVISYGTHYSGAKIGEGRSKDGMQQPAHYWDPSIAPSGMTVYDGNAFPAWDGDIFVGSLKFGLISRLEVSGNGTVREVERIETDETDRVRDLRTGPDGALWFLSVGNGALYRMTPG